jgi:hypothetical protein
VVVSSGPFVRLTVNGREVGDTVGEGEVEITVRVDAPPWMDLSRVELLVRGEVKETWKGPFKKGVTRFEQTTKREVVKGDFITVIARGGKPMSHLFRWGAIPFAFTNAVWVR